MAKRSIEPVDFSSIPRTKDLIKQLPTHARVCLAHNQAVEIHESEFLPNPGPSVPFAKADYVACCDTAIDRVIGCIALENLRR